MKRLERGYGCRFHRFIGDVIVFSNPEEAVATALCGAFNEMVGENDGYWLVPADHRARAWNHCEVAFAVVKTAE